MAKVNKKRLSNSETQKKKRKPFSFRVLFKVAIATFIMIGTYFSYLHVYQFIVTSSYFAIQKILVNGNMGVTTKEILKQSGICSGANIFTADLSSAAENICHIGQIQGATVARILPNKISITVKERIPFAILDYKGFHLVDKSGTVYWKMSSSKLIDAPIITGLYKKGATHSKNEVHNGVKYATEILTMLKVHNFSISIANISEINVQLPDTIDLYLTNSGTRIMITIDNYQENLAKLPYIMKKLADSHKEVTYIDLRFHNRGFVKFKGDKGERI
ncbi:MAG: FtsQ-type POTRA domain-containing protein [Thermodesulfobacteriota bacterium]|nr:FtsQ-type POTRA domain-containing protein [Thermodesulfobacteriota bacterium]